MSSVFDLRITRDFHMREPGQIRILLNFFLSKQGVIASTLNMTDGLTHRINAIFFVWLCPLVFTA